MSICIVADMITTFSWVLYFYGCLRCASRRSRKSKSAKSVYTSRSCTSSTITHATPFNYGSVCKRRKSIPVVAYTICVWALVTFSKRMIYPHVLPHASPRSSATRLATDNALIRRGCVQIILMSIGNKCASNNIWGICVVLPHPVEPAMIVTTLFFTVSTILSCHWYAGSVCRKRCSYSYFYLVCVLRWGTALSPGWTAWIILLVRFDYIFTPMYITRSLSRNTVNTFYTLSSSMNECLSNCAPW